MSGRKRRICRFFICYIKLFQVKCPQRLPIFDIIFVGYMKDLTRLEKERGVRPSSEIDAFMKVSIIYIAPLINLFCMIYLVTITNTFLFVIGCFSQW